jgi:Na+/H+ antiporter NhaD/arsenite permease-like protein
MLPSSSLAPLRVAPARRFVRAATAAAAVLAPGAVLAATGAPLDPPAIGPVPIDFILFGLVLAGVALFHHHTLRVALIGLATISVFKILFSPFVTGAGIAGFASHLVHEWVLIANLMLLLMGFALLSRHFEDSRVPAWLPRLLPDDWKGAFVLLFIIFVLSSFLDNIAAALIGGAIATVVFRGKVHVGYLAAIVAASNAGGSGSVVGDTTTTMMWIDGVSPLQVLEAYVAAFLAIIVFGIPASLQQHRYSPITADPGTTVTIDWARVGIVAFILVSAIVANVVVNLRYPEIADRLPFLGLTVWLAILVATPLRAPAWNELPSAARGAVFLCALVLCASMMPVHKLPLASWQTAMGLGFISAVFDNIPLTALALRQGGYDWGFLAYAVGFGGSMIWFGSSAGVALCSKFPEGRSVFAWLRAGWHVALAYVISYLFMLVVVGWHPEPKHKDRVVGAAPPASASSYAPVHLRPSTDRRDRALS